MKKIYCIVLFYLLSAVQGQAQFVSSGGPSGGADSYDFVIHNDTWFAIAGGFLLSSSDNGASWDVLNSGLLSSNIDPRALAIFENRLYVATNNEERIYRSADMGATWEVINDGLPTSTVFGVTFLRFVPLKMVVNNNRLFALGQEGLLYLNEGAVSWVNTDLSGHAGTNGFGVLEGDMIAANIGGKHYLSHDNGDTWEPFITEPPNSFGGIGVLDYIKVGDRIIVANSAGGNQTTSYSDDMTATWTIANPGFSSVTTGAAKFVHVSNDLIIGLGYNGLFKSTDQGTTWVELTDGSTRWSSYSRYIRLLPDSRLFIGTNSEAFLFDDLGEGDRHSVLFPFISIAGAGVTNSHHAGLAVYGDALYALHGDFLSRFTAQTNRWSAPVRINEYGTGYGIFSVGNMLFLLTDTGMYSSDNGVDFSLHSTFDGADAFSIHELDGRWVAVLGIKQGDLWSEVGFAYSDDQGATWQNASHNFDTSAYVTIGGPIFSGTTITRHGGTWFMGGNSRYFTSTDNGVSWSVTGTSHPALSSGSNIYSFDGALFREVFTNETQSIQKSTDGGENWANWYEGLPSVTAFSRAVKGLLAANNRLYTYNYPLYAETDEEFGLFELTSADGSWSRVDGDGGLLRAPHKFVWFNGDIFASVPGLSVWRTGSTDVSITGSDIAMPVRVLLDQNYPNPFNPATVIRFELSEASPVRLEVFDMLGRRVAVLMNETRPAGLHQAIFDGSGLSSGMYIYRLNAGAVVQTKKMMFIK